jgi:L-aminopeptidase/D-esterase-like protein
MRCLGFKGGIGSASRLLELGGKKYHVASLVCANFRGFWQVAGWQPPFGTGTKRCRFGPGESRK